MAESEASSTTNGAKKTPHRSGLTLFAVLHRTLTEIFTPNSGVSPPPPLLQRIKASLSENGPLLKDASANTGRQILVWTRNGSPLRPLLVISVGTVALIATTGMLVFMLFFVAAIFNAVVISLIMSLAAAGGFLAIFFTCLTAVYVGAISVAIFVISTATISAIVAVLVATGWLAFFCCIWLVTKKSVGIAKHSLSFTGSAISAWHTRHRNVAEKEE
ncbi:hypothetical protein LINGRAHAP2_LOCUS11879 [Linum grandiflorum]